MGNISNTTVKAHKNKRKGFNFVDFLIILIVLAIIVAAVYLFSPISALKKLSEKTTGTLNYTVEIQNVDIEFIEKIKENDTVIDSVSKNTLGTVIAIEHNTKYSELNYRTNSENPSQYEGYIVEYPDKYNVTVTVSAQADLLSGQGYTVSNCRIAVGEKLSLRFSDFVCEGYCVYVTPTADFK